MRRLIVLLLTTIVVLSLGSAAAVAQQVHIVQRGENLFRIAQQYGRNACGSRASKWDRPALYHPHGQLHYHSLAGWHASARSRASGSAAAADRHEHLYGATGRVVGDYRDQVQYHIHHPRGNERHRRSEYPACRAGIAGSGASFRASANRYGGSSARSAAGDRHLHRTARRLAGDYRGQVQHQLL